MMRVWVLVVMYIYIDSMEDAGIKVRKVFVKERERLPDITNIVLSYNQWHSCVKDVGLKPPPPLPAKSIPI